MDARPEEHRRGQWIPAAKVTGACEPPEGCWVQKLEPLEEQYALLTAELFSQPVLSFQTVCSTDWPEVIYVCNAGPQVPISSILGLYEYSIYLYTL